jgi:hypothetical protein
MKVGRILLIKLLVIPFTLLAQYDFSTETYEIPELQVRFEFFKNAKKTSTPIGWKYEKLFTTTMGDGVLAEVLIDTTIHCATRQNVSAFRKLVDDKIKEPVEQEEYDPILGYYSALYYGYSWYRRTLEFYQINGLKNFALMFHFELKEQYLDQVDPTGMMSSLNFTDQWMKFPELKMDIPTQGGLMLLNDSENKRKFKVISCSDYFRKKKLSVVFEIIDYSDRNTLSQDFETYYETISQSPGYKWSRKYDYERLYYLSKEFMQYGNESVMYETLVKSEPGNPRSFEEIFVREIFAVRDDGKVLKISVYFPMEYGWENRNDSETFIIGEFDKYVFKNIIHRIRYY